MQTATSVSTGWRVAAVAMSAALVMAMLAMTADPTVPMEGMPAVMPAEEPAATETATAPAGREKPPPPPPAAAQKPPPRKPSPVDSDPAIPGPPAIPPIKEDGTPVPYRPPRDYGVRRNASLLQSNPCARLGACKKGVWTGTEAAPDSDYLLWDPSCCDARGGGGSGGGGSAGDRIIDFSAPGAITKHFEGRRLYVLGDSVARGVAAFAEAQVQQTDVRSRLEAKQACATRQNIPSCVLASMTATPVEYSWFQWMGRHATYEDTGMIDWQEGDVCCQFVHRGGTVRDCFREMFHRATKDDVLLIRAGIEYIGFGAELRYRDYAPKLLDWRAEFVRGLHSAVGDLAATFPGKMVWLMMAPVQHLKPMYIEWDEMARTVNDIVRPVIEASPHFEGVIDPTTYSLPRQHPDYYTNGLHPGPRLQNVTLNTFLNMVL